MTKIIWGLMGRDCIDIRRRDRSLGLRKIIRNYNELAVPELGQLLYAKQLLWALLGIAVAGDSQKAGKQISSNVKVANAIEAMTSIIGIAKKVKSWRVLGWQKLRDKELCSFSQASRPSFYVSQPRRMGLVQPLLGLYLVNAETARFNKYKLSEAGETFLDLSCGSKNKRNEVQEILLGWVMGKKDLKKALEKSEALRICLDPSVPLPDRAKDFFKDKLCENKRREDAFLWVASITNQNLKNLSWEKRPKQISEDHWHDLETGALFTLVRDAALAVLEKVERQLDLMANGVLPLKGASADLELQALRDATNEFLGKKNTAGEDVTFCRACLDQDNVHVLRYLINLDGRVLHMTGDNILQGDAFRKGIGNAASSVANDQDFDEAEDDPDSEGGNGVESLQGISFRINNLIRIYKDLQITNKKK